MEYQTKTLNSYAIPQGSGEVVTEFDTAEKNRSFFQQYPGLDLDSLLTKLLSPLGKRSFLVFKNHKYINVLTDNIAFFHVRHDTTMLVTFDGQEYFVDHSLEQIQNLVAEKQFYRLNRQYLVSFNAVKEVEHYFARKMLVNLSVAVKDKLLVSKEKVSDFLHWLDNR